MAFSASAAPPRAVLHAKLLCFAAVTAAADIDAGLPGELLLQQ